MRLSSLQWLCVLALVALPVGGCSDETTAAGGSGGGCGSGATGGGMEPAPEGSVRVAFISDSITEPVGTPEAPINYPEHLVSMLGDEFDLGSFGVGGATMRRIGNFAY